MLGTLVALALLMGGCAAPVVIASAAVPAVQAGTEAFVRGSLESAQIASMEVIYSAAEQTIKDLDFRIVSQRLGKNEAYIKAKELSGRPITIDLERRSPQVTKTSIRVGVWGDQAISRLIMSEIQARTPAAPAVAPQGEADEPEP